MAAISKRPLGPVRTRAAGCALAWLVLAAAAAHGDEGDTARGELDEHRRLWEEAAIDAYEYGYNKYCECHRETPPETRVAVRGGKVVGVRHQPFGFEHFVEAEPRNFEWYWTIDGLFALVATALERGVDFRVDYDASLGYPTHVYIDHDPSMIGEELDVRVTRLERLAD